MSPKNNRQAITNQILYDEIKEVKRVQKDLYDVSIKNEKNISSLMIYSKDHFEKIKDLESNVSGLEGTVRENEDCLKDVAKEQTDCLKKHEEERLEKKNVKFQTQDRRADFRYAIAGFGIAAALNIVIKLIWGL